VFRPVTPEGDEPCVELHEGLESQAIQAALRFNSRFHEPSLAQDAQMLGDGWLRQAKIALDFANGALGREQQAQDGPSVGLCDDGKR